MVNLIIFTIDVVRVAISNAGIAEKLPGEIVPSRQIGLDITGETLIVGAEILAAEPRGTSGSDVPPLIVPQLVDLSGWERALLVSPILDLLVKIADTQRGCKSWVKLVKNADGRRVYHVVQIELTVVGLRLAGRVAVIVSVNLLVLFEYAETG